MTGSWYPHYVHRDDASDTVVFHPQTQGDV